MADGRTIGIVPAAGLGTRLGSLPGSKELLPVPMSPVDSGPLVSRPVCTALIELMRQGGIKEALFILRSGKWDIPECLGDGSQLEMHIGYLIMRHPFGAPFTLDAAYPFVRDATVALGFPDVLIEPHTVFRSLLGQLETSGADMALGLFPTDRPYATDMVRMNDRGRVLSLDMRPKQTKLKYAWCIAAWRPQFTEFLHSWVEQTLSEADADATIRAVLGRSEQYVGTVIQAAIDEGLYILGVPVSEQPFLDIGTPETYARALERLPEVVNRDPS